MNNLNYEAPNLSVSPKHGIEPTAVFAAFSAVVVVAVVVGGGMFAWEFMVVVH